MKQRIPLAVLILAALSLGLCIAWVDSRPTWDDTGITVFSVLLISFCFGFLKPKYAILWALLIGMWIPIIEIALSGAYASLIALVVAFIGALLGAAAHRLMPKQAASV